MKKIALKLKILQEVSNKQRVKDGLPKLGKGYSTAVRLNPYNPLSYIFYICLTIGSITCGIFEKVYEAARYNPFEWD